VPRSPEVFVRPLMDQEQPRLLKIARRTRDPVKLRRAMIVQMSSQGRSVTDIVAGTGFSERYVREVIHAFNEHGFEAFSPKWSGGRTPIFTEAIRQQIRTLALSRPREVGAPFTCWSLTKLREQLIRRGVVATISCERLRQILADYGITFQRTKTFKASPDPDYEAKKNRILALYDHPPADGRVICLDEFGPLNLQPHRGVGWFERGHPARLRATYKRPHGVRQMLAALDLATGTLTYRIRKRKRWIELLAFLKILRARWPDQKLYVVLDNFSPHRRRELREWCAANDVALVFTPTYASWLNWIEAEFTALRHFVLNNSDYRTHTEQAAAIRAYIRWKNRRATPKRNFAINSAIRAHPQEDYLHNVA
jgi:transposase